MKNSIVLIPLFLLISISSLLAQGEGNNWYFGNYAGITFNTSPPSVLTNGKLITSEGCASVSSKDGLLVFYTDGSTVYDANHNIMTNGTGLYGNNSSTQSSVVCPKPGTYNYGLRRFDNYYIVTIDVSNGNKGVRYTEVDMTLNGGLGDIVTTKKNIHLFGTTTIEGANVVKHSNGCDYWIIGKEVGNNTFKVYLISSSGVSTTPVISNQGAVSGSTWGSIKVSPSNNLVSFNSNSVGTQVFDFNNSTGALTLKFSDPQLSYSSEFSPNSKILYVTHLPSPDIWQYDLTSANNAAFLSSKLLVGVTSNTGGGYKMCGVQLAPNGKIYCSLTGQTRLGAIENPNILGLGCTYNDNALSIAGVNTTNNINMNTILGLPAFPAFFIFPNEVEYESANYSVNQYFCNSDSITFKVSNISSVQSVEWYLAPINTAFPSTPTSTATEYKIPPPSSGDYKILSIVDYSCFIDTIVDTITVNSLPSINLGPNIDSCTNASITIDGTSSTGNSYLWNDASTNPIKSISNSGQYHLEVTDALGCKSYDTVNITINEVPNASFTAPPVCLNNLSEFNNLSSINSGSIISNQWSFGDNNSSNNLNPSNTYVNDGNYNVQLIVTSNNNCKNTTTLSHTVYPIPTTDAGIDTTLNCLNESIILDGSLSSSGPNFEFLWTSNNGNFINATNNNTVTIDKNGKYYLRVTNSTNNCFILDSVEVAIDTIAPSFNIGIDTILTCQNTNIALNAINNQSGSFNYNWTTNTGNIQSGNSTLTPQINKTGVYYLTVQNNINYCSTIDSLNIGIDTIKPISMVNSDTLINCINPSIFLNGNGSSIGNYSYNWTTNTGNITSGSLTLTPEINVPGLYTLNVTNNFNGCTSTSQTNVSQNDSAFVNIVFNESTDSNFSIYSFDENIINYIGNNGPIQWYIDNTYLNDDTLINYTFEESGNHQIIIELENIDNGCIVYDTTNIIVTHRLIIPSVLSPNSDGYNDIFLIRALENFENSSLTIFNRWGESVFSASPYENDWNGQVNTSNILLGREVVDGTYFYLLTLEKNGKETIQKGSIEVKRK